MTVLPDTPPRGTQLLRDAMHCARFLRGAAVHSARHDDVYISSYPRSGTTWLSLLVHLVQGGEPDFEHISNVVPWYERDLSLGRATAADFAQLASPRVFKSHLPYAWLPRGARYVYALRDGRDVLVSYYEFYRSHLDYRGTWPQFFERFLRGELQYRSWFRHVRDFQRAAGPNVLLVRYEDMLRDPGQALHAVARLCERTISPERERAILDATSFAAMKRLEHKFDHAVAEHAANQAERTDDNGVRSVPAGAFVRSGRSGDHHAQLTAAEQERFAHVQRSWRRRYIRELRLADFLH